MISPCCRSEVKYGSHWAHVEVLAGLCSFLEFPGDSFICLFYLLVVAYITWQ